MRSGGCAGIASDVSEPEKSTPAPADRLLDLFVFAPAGLALTIVEELPNLAEKGRNRIEGRTATARVVGQFAVQMGFRELVKRARQFTDPQPPPRRHPGNPAAHRGVPAVRTTPAVSETTREEDLYVDEYEGRSSLGSPDGLPERDVYRGDSYHHHAGGRSGAGANGHAGAGAGAGDLAIPAYDTLSASQVVKRLAGLSHEELFEVGEHERKNRHRATILTRVEQLLSGDPALGG